MTTWADVAAGAAHLPQPVPVIVRDEQNTRGGQNSQNTRMTRMAHATRFVMADPDQVAEMCKDPTRTRTVAEVEALPSIWDPCPFDDPECRGGWSGPPEKKICAGCNVVRKEDWFCYRCGALMKTVDIAYPDAPSKLHRWCQHRYHDDLPLHLALQAAECELRRIREAARA